MFHLKHTLITGKSQTTITAYLMLLPFYLAFTILYLIPIILVFIYSFTDYNLVEAHFIGFKQYIKLWSDHNFIISLRNTTLYAVFTIISTMTIGLLVATLLNLKLYSKGLYRLSIFMPYIISMVAASMIWLWIYEPTFGILNFIIEKFGMQSRQWLMNEKYALMSIIIMSIWKLIGYNMIVYLAGLQQIPEYLYEAAKIDGAKPIHVFTKITLPLLSPTTFFLFVNACIESFKVFEQINVMTKGGPVNSTTTVVHQIYNRAFLEMNMGYASAISVVLFIIIAMITFCNFLYGNKNVSFDLG